MNKILIPILSIFILNACGFGDTKESKTAGVKPPKGDTKMIVNQQYAISKGSYIFKESDSAKVKIIHSDGSSKSTVILIEGAATLRRN